MANPLYSITLNGIFFRFIDGSYKQSINVKSSTSETQSSRAFSALGLGFPQHSMTLVCENSHQYIDYTSNVIGTTASVGVSMLADLKNLCNYVGNSLPLTLVIGDGSTHLVVPFGTLDISYFIDSPKASGVEYRVDLTLVNTQ